MGKLCIEVSPTDKIAAISETLCIGCGICIKVSAVLLCYPIFFILILLLLF
jgi:translation initiation factor RLI1